MTATGHSTIIGTPASDLHTHPSRPTRRNCGPSASIGAPIATFLQAPENTNPRFSLENRGFVFNEFGGEGEIRTLDTVSCIHTFQACSLSHSDTSPCLGKLFSLSRRANVVESFPDGKGFFENFHALKMDEDLKSSGHGKPDNLRVGLYAT